MSARRGKVKRKTNMRSLVLAVAGPEQPYPVYQFSKDRRKIERPRHNPFAGLAD
jgi:hypothetical protein